MSAVLRPSIRAERAGAACGEWNRSVEEAAREARPRAHRKGGRKLGVRRSHAARPTRQSGRGPASRRSLANGGGPRPRSALISARARHRQSTLLLQVRGNRRAARRSAPATPTMSRARRRCADQAARSELGLASRTCIWRPPPTCATFGIPTARHAASRSSIRSRPLSTIDSARHGGAGAGERR